MNLLDRLPWDNGRQGTGYKKLCLFESRRFLFDCYLLYFPIGTDIPPHTDPIPVERYGHYRLNIILVKAIEGGIFLCKNILFNSSIVKFFRPDIEEHSVTKISKGYRLVLSIGWLKKLSFVSKDETEHFNGVM